MREILYNNNKNINKKFKEKKIIPYSVSEKSRYETNKWYYNNYWNQIMKVLSVKYNENDQIEQCYVVWEDDLYGLICTDLDVCDYRLEKDFKCIYKDDIINSNKIYTGAEIIYWFFINNITYYDKKYRGFWKFVDSNSDHKLCDTNKYIISGQLDNRGIYKNCRVRRVKRN